MGIGEIDKRKGSKRKKEKPRRERKGDGVHDQRRSPARRDPDDGDSSTRRRTPISDDDDDGDANADLTIGILEQARQRRKAAGGHLPSPSPDEDVGEDAVPDLRVLDGKMEEGKKDKKKEPRRERKRDAVQDKRRSPARRDPDDSPTRRRTPISDDDDDEDANEDLTLGILEQVRQCRKAAGGHPGDGHLPSLSSDEDVGEGAIPDLREEDRKDGKKDKKKKSKRKKTNRMKGEGDAIPDLGEEDGIAVAAATGKHLMKTKQHLRELFVSKAESVVCESLDDFILKHLKGTDRTLEVAVPGSKEKKTYLVPALVCRLCTNELAELLVKIIQAGWSFSVDLDPTDFVVTPLGHLKIALQKMEFLEHANLNSIKKNAATAALIVRGCIFNNSPLPHDVNCFVTVLEQFNGNCKAMIHHPGLKDEVAKLSQFEVLYMRSVQIFHLDKVKHKRIMDKLPYCHVNKNHWKLKMEANLHFERILKHTKRKSWQLREPVSVDQEQSEGQDEGSHRSKRRRLSTSEKRKLKKQGQEPLLPVGVTQQPRHLVSETAQAVKSEGYKVTPDIAKRVRRATLADDSLFPLMTREIGAQVSKIVAGQPKYPPVFGEEAEADVKAFFQVLLDLILVEYADDGSALSGTVRNSQVHVVLDFSVQPARAGHTISEGKKKRKKKKARPPEPAALRFTYAQVEHMIGCTLPGFLCQFYSAMADEDEIDTANETTTWELCLGCSSQR